MLFCLGAKAVHEPKEVADWTMLRKQYCVQLQRDLVNKSLVCIKFFSHCSCGYLILGGRLERLFVLVSDVHDLFFFRQDSRWCKPELTLERWRALDDFFEVSVGTE